MPNRKICTVRPCQASSGSLGRTLGHGSLTSSCSPPKTLLLSMGSINSTGAAWQPPWKTAKHPNVHPASNTLKLWHSMLNAVVSSWWMTRPVQGSTPQLLRGNRCSWHRLGVSNITNIWISSEPQKNPSYFPLVQSPIYPNQPGFFPLLICQIHVFCIGSKCQGL